jgi:Flp pilus assembly protein TadG
VLYLMILFSVFNFGYIMYFHQTLQDRARAAARYGALNPTDTTGMRNVALYYDPAGSGAGLFGLTSSNVSAARSGAGTAADRVTVTISGYTYFAFWPAVSGEGKAVTVSIPVEAN